VYILILWKSPYMTQTRLYCGPVWPKSEIAK